MNLKKRILNSLPELINVFKIRVPVKVKIFNQKTKSIFQNQNKYIYKSSNKPIPLGISCAVTFEKGNNPIAEFGLFYNSDIWNDANNNELVGNLAHELGHVLVIQEGFVQHINIYTNNGWIANEMIVDAIGVSKGYIKEMMESRRYLVRKCIEIFKYDNLNIEKSINNGELIRGLSFSAFQYILNTDCSKAVEEWKNYC